MHVHQFLGLCLANTFRSYFILKNHVPLAQGIIYRWQFNAITLSFKYSIWCFISRKVCMCMWCVHLMSEHVQNHYKQGIIYRYELVWVFRLPYHIVSICVVHWFDWINKDYICQICLSFCTVRVLWSKIMRPLHWTSFTDDNLILVSASP